jgi:hypothetical protein
MVRDLAEGGNAYRQAYPRERVAAQMPGSRVRPANTTPHPRGWGVRASRNARLRADASGDRSARSIWLASRSRARSRSSGRAMRATVTRSSSRDSEQVVLDRTKRHLPNKRRCLFYLSCQVKPEFFSARTLVTPDVIRCRSATYNACITNLMLLSSFRAYT